MATRITDALMISDLTPHWAWQDRGDPGMWAVTWLPDALRVDRNQAITAMVLAEAAETIAAQGGRDLAGAWAHRLWPHLRNWAAELAMGPAEAFEWARKPLPPADPDAFINPRGQVHDLSTGRWVYVAQGRDIAVAAQGAPASAASVLSLGGVGR